MKKIFFLFFLFLSEKIFSQELPKLTTFIKVAKEDSCILIDKEQLENFSSIKDALENVGFSFKNSNDEICFLGLWNSSIKVYVDDILMNSCDTGKFDWSTIDFSLVKSIIIDTNSTNGAAAIFIRTFDADYTKIKFSINYDSKSFLTSPFDSNRLNANFSMPLNLKSGSSFFIDESFSAKNSLLHFGYRSEESSYKPTFKESYRGYKKKYSGYESYLLNNSFAAEYSTKKFPGATFGLKNFISYENSNCGNTEGEYYVHQKQKDLNIATSIPIFLPLKTASIKIQSAHKFSDLHFTKDARFSSEDDEYKINNFSFNAKTNVLKYFNFLLGFSYDHSMQNTLEKSKITNSLFTADFECGANFSIKNFYFSLTLPVNYFERENKISILYKADFFWKYKNFLLGFKSSKSVTNPVFQQLYYSGSGGIGNKNLKPENAINFTVSAKYENNFFIIAEPYFIFYDGKISWTQNEDRIWQCMNTGSSINYGARINFNSKELLKNFYINLNYTLCRAFLTTDSKVYSNQIMLTPLHTFGATFKIKFYDCSLSSDFLWQSEKFTDNSNASTVPNYFDLNLKFSFQRKYFSFFMQWNNIFDFCYVPVSAYPTEGTSIVFGIKIRN